MEKELRTKFSSSALLDQLQANYFKCSLRKRKVFSFLSDVTFKGIDVSTKPSEKIGGFVNDKVLGVMCETEIMVQRLIKNCEAVYI